ncbi:hypothetical protein HanPSC8_Chr17g0764141 [Helianthus annuus]|nr:hypothetical protein HanPSC8_Chr17g0764141 [Helianthus annuus]
MSDAEERKTFFMSVLENPAADILSPVSLVRWHPSATTCCSGSKARCITLRNLLPSAATCSTNMYIPPGLSTLLTSARNHIDAD